MSFDFNTMLEQAKTSKKVYDDGNFFKFKKNDAGAGTALVRFFPVVNGDSILPYIELKEFNVSHKHLTKSTKFINKTFSVNELFEKYGTLLTIKRKLKEIGTDEAKKVSDTIKLRTVYVTAIKVLKAPLQTEDEGKIFKYKFGVKLYDKFMGWFQKSEEEISMGEKPVNIWNLKDGANVKLVVKQVANFPNYDETSLSEGKCLKEFCDLDADEITKKLKENEELNFSEFTKETNYDVVKDLAEVYKDTWIADYLEETLPEIFKGKFEKVAENETKTEVKKVGANEDSNEDSNETKSETPKETVKETSKETVSNESSNETPKESEDDDLDFLDDF